MAFFLNEDGLEASLEDMPSPFHLAIHPLRVDAVEMPHTTREIRVGCLDQQVDSVATAPCGELGRMTCSGQSSFWIAVAWANYVRLSEQAIGMTEPTVAFDYLSQEVKECAVVRLCEEDLLASRSGTLSGHMARLGTGHELLAP